MAVQRWVALDPDEIKELSNRHLEWRLEDDCATVVIRDPATNKHARGHTLKQAFDALKGLH